MNCRVFAHIAFALTTFLLLAAAGGISTAEDGNWPRYRGADGLGRVTDPRLPTEWDESNVAWKTSLDGVGQSAQFGPPLVGCFAQRGGGGG